jgi:hypothetical protein
VLPTPGDNILPAHTNIPTRQKITLFSPLKKARKKHCFIESLVAAKYTISNESRWKSTYSNYFGLFLEQINKTSEEIVTSSCYFTGVHLGYAA